jgi:type IV secretion system protein VirB10
MRLVMALVLLAGFAAAQTQPETKPASPPALAPAASHVGADEVTIPEGTHIPVMLKNAISTKSSRVGDPIYAQSTFPVVVNNRIVVPAGTYVQGKISSIKPAGHLKGRAEVLVHFTTLIYPSGYTVILPGAIENAPGVDTAHTKDKEGTIQADSNKAKTAGTIAGPAAEGGLIGAVTHGGEGALIGAGIGGAIGTTIAALSKSNEVRMGPGTTLEVVLQRDVPVDAHRIRIRPFDRAEVQ